MRSIANINEILEMSGMRPSPVRQLVLRTLLEAERPLSSLDIETRLETVDRSSITRTLVLFVEKDIVHSFEDGSGSMKYEPCLLAADGHHHHHGDDGHEYSTDLHPHFHCLKCGETTCLDHLEIPNVPLPEGYTRHSSTYIIKGICPRCQNR